MLRRNLVSIWLVVLTLVSFAALRMASADDVDPSLADRIASLEEGYAEFADVVDQALNRIDEAKSDLLTAEEARLRLDKRLGELAAALGSLQGNASDLEALAALEALIEVNRIENEKVWRLSLRNQHVLCHIDPGSVRKHPMGADIQGNSCP